MAITIVVNTDLSAAQKIPAQLAPATNAFKGMQDQMAKMERSTTASMAAMRAGMQGLAQQIRPVIFGQNELGASFIKTGQAAGATTAQLAKLAVAYGVTGAAAKKAADDTAKAASGLSSRGREMMSLMAAVGVGFSLKGLIDFGKSVVEAGIAHDRLMLSLKGALGTAQAAGEAYAFVEGVANRLGINLLTAAESFAKLSAATQGTVIQGQQTRDLFVSISEAARVMGLNSAEVGGITTALTQIIGKNTVSMEELRQQLGERLPSALRLTAKEMGLTTSRFIEMVSKGEVLATEFIPAVTRALKQMGAEAPEAAKSVQAALERVGNAWLALKVTIAQSGVLEALAKVAEEATRIIKLTTDSINRTQRMAGEMGMAGLVGEMQRVTQELQAQQEILAKIEKLPRAAEVMAQSAGTLPGPTVAVTQANIKVLEAQRDALADTIALKQKAMETDERTRKAAEETTKQDIANATAKEQQIALVSKATTVWTANTEAIKQNELALKALRSFDVDILQQAFQIDPFGDQALFEQRWNQAEATLLKQQKELLDKRAGINKGDAARAVQEAGQSAVERAKAVEDALAAQLQREERMIEMSADKRRQAIDTAASAALAEQGPGAVATIEARRQQDILRVAIETAQALEKLRLDTLKQQTAARETALQAEMAAAGKNLSAQTKAQEALKNLYAETEAERAKITQQRTNVEQQISKKSVDEQIKDARELNRLIQETAEDRLRASLDVSDAQITLIQAQVDGEILTYQEGAARIQAIQEQRIETTRQLYIMQAEAAIAAIDAEVRETALGQQQIAKIRAGLTDQLQGLNIQQQTQQQEHLNELTQGWRDWVQDVRGALGNFLFEWMDGQIDSIKDVLDSLKSYFFRLIADMAAHAATKAIVVPIVGSLLGGFGGASGAVGAATQGAGLLSQLLGIGGTGSADSGLGAVQGLGLLASMRTVVSGFTNGLTGLTKVLLNAGSTISTTFGGPTLGILPEGVSMQGVLNVGPAAGLAGGLAALGGGIYGALNAANTASRAAFAASAAAGALAAASTAAGAGLLGASAGTAALTGWTGVGLIAAAVMAVIGVVLDKVIKPAGPALAVGRPSGLGIGVQDGRLAVSGDLGSRVLRREGIDPGMARGVQAQLEEGLTNAVVRIVETINAVALDPAALLGPTQEALQRALANIRPINTANAKRMEQDITEQLRFVNVQIVAGMLGPLNEAFNQLRDQGDLQDQLDRLPATTAGLVEVFKTMNTHLSEMGASQNTDVLRQLSGVKNQVENFGNRIAGTAAQIAESIVNELVTSMQQTVVPTLAGQIRQFSGLMDTSFRALTELRATQQTLEGAGLQGGGVGAQIDRLTKTMSEQAERISTEIVSGALEDLAQELDVILIQPIRVQATTVNGLFTDSLAALNALWVEWHRLEGAGIDASRVREQFDQLLGGMLDSVQRITEQAFSGGSFTQFLNVLLSIPEALANLNPITQQIRQMGLVFAQVAGPIEEVIRAVSLELQTPVQRAADTRQRMFELRDAIAQTGGAIDQALPLYAQLSQAIQANATAQIEAWNEWADEQSRLVNEAFDAQREALRTWVDESTTAWNKWAETQLDAVNQWVETSTKMINDWAESAQTVADQLATVNDILLGEMSPAQQRTTLEGRKAELEAVVNATGSPEALTELISVNRQLLELAKQSDDLALVMQSQQELKAIQKYLQEQLFKATGQTDPVLAQITIAKTQEAWLEYIAIQQDIQAKAITDAQEAQIEAIQEIEKARLKYLETTQETQLKAIADAQAAMIRAIKVDMVYQLQLVQYELQKMFAMQYKVLTGIDLAPPVHPSQMLTYDPATGGPRPPVLFQRGGIAGLASGVHYAQGGLVPTILEPGERVMSGPFTHAQQGALMSMNQAFPRFAAGGWTVPGSGSGDTVPAWVPSGSFVMNRSASRAMGFQHGGPVPGSAPAMPPIVIDLRGSQFGSAADASKVRNILEREVVRIWEQYQRRTRVDTRLN